ncbi:MAG: hypothetical protein U9Q38_08200, partial [Thermodesulfobacteriota bacterium]|nr:hypothetical protein [Thermodesulfobacteriota bacterium]
MENLAQHSKTEEIIAGIIRGSMTAPVYSPTKRIRCEIVGFGTGSNYGGNRYAGIRHIKMELAPFPELGITLAVLLASPCAGGIQF